MYTYCFLQLTLLLSLLIQDAKESEWKEMQLPSEADSINLKDLAFGSGYQLEIMAVNANGSSMPATFNFTIAELPGMLSPIFCTVNYRLS